MVLEDDLLFEPKMCEFLDITIPLVEKEEIVFLGMPNNQPIEQTKTVIIRSCDEIFKILPYNDSYIITASCAKILSSKWMPIKFYTNIQMNYVMETNNIKMKQTVPNIFVDGSKVGMYLSTQLANNELIYNRDYVVLKSLIGREPNKITVEEKDIANQIIKNANTNNNPDLLAVAGKYTRDILGNYTGARDMYQRAYDTYQKNGVIMNNESWFLRDFINLHAHLQTDI